MVRYFIDILDGDHAFRDDIGSDFADLESAQAEVIQALPEVANYRSITSDLREVIATVRDESGLAVYRATLIVKGEQLTD